MAIDPGFYTVQQLLDLAGVDPAEAAKVDYNDRGWDSNLLRVGGLRFDELDEVINVPEAAIEVVVEANGETIGTVPVNTVSA